MARLSPLMTVLLWVASGNAQPPPDVGDTAWALPGIIRTSAPSLGDARLSGALALGYGYTEAQTPDDGSHHRGIGKLAIGLRPIDWLSLSLNLGGRYDKHPADAEGGDDGWVGDPRLAARVSHFLGDQFGLGAELVAWLPGSSAPSLELGATSVSAKALLSFALPDVGLTAVGNLGYRLDQSADSVQTPERLRQGDRIALGINEYDALLLGAGLSYRTGALELLGEFSWDLLVGDGAPPPRTSPVRVGGGVRYHATDEWQLEVIGEGSLSRRPSIGPTAPLIAIEPRIAVLAGLRYRMSLAPEAPAPEPLPDDTPPPPPEEPEPTTGTVEGQLLDDEGQPVAGATIAVRVGDAELEAETDIEGRYVLEEVPLGTATITATAEGYERSEQTVEVDAEEPAQPEIRLTAKPPAGQIRGLIRDFRGRPLSAKIEIQPGDVETETGADGRFEVDVPPGRYTVQVKARGYRPQRRVIVVEEQGVTILNAELRRGR